MDYDDFDTYNGDTEHNMWVDFDNIEHTGTPVVFDEPDLDNLLITLTTWINETKT